MAAKHRERATDKHGSSRSIECLACGDVRTAQGTSAGATGECPRCGYLGWAFTSQLDAPTKRMILNGGLARRRPLNGFFGALDLPGVGCYPD